MPASPEMEDPQTKLGGWSMVRILGTGGFGLVTLWKNETTGENIAIKSLREKELQGVIQEKHKSRWCKEVEIMKKLKHKNVVEALEVPEDLKPLQTKSPVLAMEFCKIGDLRQELVKPENCCGFNESLVFNILRDISNGLSYLHSSKVIHRDLKPDNVVLQETNEGVVYKLTDLGFAKELDQNSLCESFVVTIQYLAPELFLGKPYTSSVDFWSFGLIAHEIITGHRPFLPGNPPVVWMKHIQDKKRSVISVFQSWSGEVIMSSSLSRINNFASCLRADMEQWLQLALDWNGSTRGRHTETLELTLFSSLQELMSKQVVRIFSVPSAEVLSYTVRKDTSVSNLQQWIARDTGLEPDDQTLMLSSGKTLNSKANLLNNLPEKGDSEDIVLYLFSPGMIVMQSKTILQPLSTRELLADPKMLMDYQRLKRSASDAIFFLRSESDFYMYLIQALKAKAENVNQRCAALATLYEDVVDEWSQVEACSQFFVLSHKADLENYIELRKSKSIESSDLVQKWIKKASDVETKLNELRSSGNRNQMKLEVEAVSRAASALMQQPLLKTSRTPLNDLVDAGLQLYRRVQNIPKDVRGHQMCNSDFARTVNKSMEISAKMLKSKDLTDIYQQIYESEDSLARLISPLTILLKSTKVMRNIIEATQKERQRDIWGLLVHKPPQKPLDERKNEPKPEPDTTVAAKGKFSPFHIPKTVVYNDLVSPVDDHILRPDFRVSGPVSIGHLHGHSIEMPSFASDIIKTNNELVYRTKDLAQTCSSLVKEVQSLNWDYLKEP